MARPLAPLVTFRFRPPESIRHVDLRGEMLDFQRRIDMEPRHGGVFEIALRLEPGTYEYKYRLETDEWLLDPTNPRTRSRFGHRNSVLVIGGAAEPILHAPASPWISFTEDERLVVRAGVRHGASDGLRLRWSESTERHTEVMGRLFDEGEHRIFETVLPISTHHLEYVFELDDGTVVGAEGGAGQAFRIRPWDMRHPVPEWWKDAVLYTIFVDRFRRGDGSWPNIDAETLEQARAGGDLLGARQALPYLADLGVDVLHLTPIAHAPSAHRYAAIDPRRVDPDLGGEEAFDAFLSSAHSLGIRVILDVAITHVHMEHAHFVDVRERGPLSPYFDWFFVERLPFAQGVPPGYRHYGGEWQEPLLRTSNPDVREYIVGTFEHWAGRGVDGFRIDAAADVDPPLIGAIARGVRAVNPNAVIFGEVIPSHLHRYLRHGLDAATDFATAETLLAPFIAGTPVDRELLRARRIERGGPGYCGIVFGATHDQHRLATRLQRPEVVRLAQLLMLMRPEVPMLLYGEEVGLAAPAADRNFEDVWPDRRPMPWDPAEWDQETRRLVATAIDVRKSSRALTRGETLELDAQVLDGDPDRVIAFRRFHHEEVIDVLVNASDGDARVEIPGGAPSEARPLLTHGHARLDEGTVTLGPWAGVVLAREAARDALAQWTYIREHNHEIAAEAFRRGATEMVALPSAVYLTITERCNISCRHCITHAPTKTQEGTAREIHPWVLDALGETFATARYVGFSHGGESLTSPRLFDALTAIQAARVGPAPDVHLLTNGMLLTRARLERLVELGVTSLAVSIDGATSETNDVLRAGSELSKITKNIQQAVRLRDNEQWNLRIGISSVVSKSNTSEVLDLARLALDLGVDWLKLEEMFPATLIAKEQLVPRSRMLERLAAARDLLEGTRVRFVDHVEPPMGGCWCKNAARPAWRELREADDFANRTHFVPCRMPYEQACIDPDGSVHAVDYFSPVIGNLAKASMLEIWNSRAVQQQRLEALARVRGIHETCPDEPWCRPQDD